MRDGLGLHPQHPGQRARVVLAAQLGEVAAGRHAELRGEVLDEDGHEVRRDDHPEQQGAVGRAGERVRREVAGVDVGGGRDDRGSEQREQAADTAGGRERGRGGREGRARAGGRGPDVRGGRHVRWGDGHRPLRAGRRGPGDAGPDERPGPPGDGPVDGDVQLVISCRSARTGRAGVDISMSAVAWTSSMSSLSSPGPNSSGRSTAISIGTPSGACSVVSSVPSFDGDGPLKTFAASLSWSMLNVYCLLLQSLVQQRLDLGEALRTGLRDRQELVPLHAERLERLRVGVLVGLVAHDQVRDRRPCGLVGRHLVEPALLQAPGRLEHEVVEQVQRQVAAVVDVLAGPRVALRVHRQRALGADQPVVDVAAAERHRQRRRAALAGLVEVRGVALVAGRAVDEAGDRRGDELDVADLLGAHAVEQVAERLARRPAEIEALEQVLHHRAHLAELTAQPLLQGVRGRRVRLVRDDLVDQALHMEEHVDPLEGRSVRAPPSETPVPRSCPSTSPGPSPPRAPRVAPPSPQPSPPVSRSRLRWAPDPCPPRRRPSESPVGCGVPTVSRAR